VQDTVVDWVVANFDAVERTDAYEKIMEDIDEKPGAARVLAKLLKAQRAKGKRYADDSSPFTLVHDADHATGYTAVARLCERRRKTQA
jgi:hypothetical protein